jgi:hypothetical protein
VRVRVKKMHMHQRSRISYDNAIQTLLQVPQL